MDERMQENKSQTKVGQHHAHIQMVPSEATIRQILQKKRLTCLPCPVFVAKDCDERKDAKRSEQGNEDRLDQVICC